MNLPVITGRKVDSESRIEINYNSMKGDVRDEEHDQESSLFKRGYCKAG